MSESLDGRCRCQNLPALPTRRKRREVAKSHLGLGPMRWTMTEVASSEVGSDPAGTFSCRTVQGVLAHHQLQMDVGEGTPHDAKPHTHFRLFALPPRAASAFHPALSSSVSAGPADALLWFPSSSTRHPACYPSFPPSYIRRCRYVL